MKTTPFLVSVALNLLVILVSAAEMVAVSPTADNADTIGRLRKLGVDEIVFVKRKPFSADHYYTEVNNGTRADLFLPNNGIYIYDLRTGRERPVVRAVDLPGGKGIVGKINLSFDAQKIIFDYRPDPASAFRIWEVKTDGTELRQVSFPPVDEAEKANRWRPNWHTDDIHPCYLPDGGIVFCSTRCEHTILCGGATALVGLTLHRMAADGSHVEALTQSPVTELCPTVLDDGRIMYHRWEYVDRGARVAKTIWAIRADGTGSHELFGLQHDSTTTYMFPRPLPGSNHHFVAVGTCHYPQGNSLGPILVVDFGKGTEVVGPDPNEPGFVPGDERHPVVNITPEVFVGRRDWYGWWFQTAPDKYELDKTGRKGTLYTEPYPISDKEFVVSYKVKAEDHCQSVANAYALGFVDTKGGRQLIHADKELSLWHALPVTTRRVPPSTATVRDPKYAANQQAVCVLSDIYRGMPGIKRGDVKWLRINEVLPRFWSTTPRWAEDSSSSWKAALWPRVQWGIVPVEDDGSACFVVPANRSIFLQALDENFQELQRERTYVNYAPGEVRSCVGCHVQSHMGPDTASSRLPKALRRDPSRPQPQPCDLVANGGDGQPGQTIHYPSDIQPIFNSKCVSCHGSKEPAGKLRLTDELTAYYNTSYEELAKKKLAGPIIAEFTSLGDGDRGNYNGALLPPKSLGTHNSVLMSLLTDPKHRQNAQDDHSKMLTPREMMIMARWVDSNYQFYGSYFGRRNPRWAQPDAKSPAYDPADFRRRPTFTEATGFLAPEWHR